MKNLRNGFLALALVAGVSGAFVSKIHAAPKRADALYNWQKFNHDGTRDMASDEQATIADAESDYGCSSTVTKCATGTIVPGSGSGSATATLRFSN